MILFLLELARLMIWMDQWWKSPATLGQRTSLIVDPGARHNNVIPQLCYQAFEKIYLFLPLQSQPITNQPSV